MTCAPQMIQRLYKAAKSGALPHAILLSGQVGSRACAYAREAAAILLTGAPDTAALINCPDYFELGPEPIAVGAIRELQDALCGRAYGERRAIVFLEAHTMNAFAQNALLKTLEEPPARTTMLLAGQQEGLLSTIRSRCMCIRIGAQPRDAIIGALLEEGIAPAAAGLAAFLSDGAPDTAAKIATSAHEAFFFEAAKLLFTCLEASVTPYQAAAALLDQPLEPDKEARSKAAKQRPNAQFLLRVWAALLEDMLYCKLQMPPNDENPLYEQTLQLAGRFTTGQIQCMIDLVLAAMKRLSVANPGLTLDALVTRLTGGCRQ